MTTSGVILIGLGTPRSAGENIGCTWEHLGAWATSLGVPTTNLRAPGSADDKPVSTSNYSRTVWEIQLLLWECC